MTENLIELINVEKSFSSLKAADNITFSVKRGSIYGLLGPNGAGKTTIIRMIMNILAPDRGRITINGKKISEDSKDSIGYLPEERGLYKKLKVNEMLQFIGQLKSVGTSELQSSIDKWLEIFELTKWKNNRISELSKGMTQKVQFIGSVIHNPELLILDEPFSGLDPISADMMNGIILKLNSEGTTILFSTHIMDHAEKICSNIFLIDRGKGILSGPLQQIKDNLGKKSIIIEFDGNGGFIKSLPMVEKVIEYTRFVEVELKDSRKSDEFLKSIIGKIEIHKFEVVSPSLHKIFIDTVGENEKPE
ncbi:MAG: ATP-binding cassette domain-containing protein [Spirochaetes bacterium]|nr:ATP-binding cassette domain-containing protein [Spirochaetota bacterium]